MIAVVIPCKNQEHIIKLTIENLKTFQTVKPDKIIIVDDQSDSFNIKDDNIVVTLSTKDFNTTGRSDVRNIGIKKALNMGADILIFLDGDCIPANEFFISNYVTSLKNDNNTVIFGMRKHVFEIRFNGTVLKSNNDLKKLPSDLLTANLGKNINELESVDLRESNGTVERFNKAIGTEVDDYILSGWICWSCNFATTSKVLKEVYHLNYTLKRKGCYFDSEEFGDGWGCEDAAFGLDAYYTKATIKLTKDNLIYHLMHDASNNYDSANNERRRHVLFNRYRRLLCNV